MRPLHLLLLQRERHRLRLQRGAGRRLFQAGLSLGAAAAVFLAAAIFVLAWGYSSLTSDLPPIAQLPALLNQDNGLFLEPTRLYDRTGQQIILTLQDPGAERRYLIFDPLKPDHFSPYLIQATIGINEPDFWSSPGIELYRWTDPLPATIAERLVDRLLLADEPAGLRRALRMRLLAAQITSRYGRAQVLEWHLNSAYYGRMTYGAESAARLYLGKSASDLNLAEAALLVAAEQAPALNPIDAATAALERGQSILQQLATNGRIGEEEYAQSAAFTPQLAVPAPAPFNPAPAFTNLVLEQLNRRFGRTRIEQGGLKIITSLDLNLQTQVSCTIQAQLTRLAGRPTSSAALAAGCPAGQLLPALTAGFQPIRQNLLGSAVLVDLATGQVMALAGNSLSGPSQAALTGLQPGTLLTPFLAVSAFARGFGPASLVWDIPGQVTADLEKLARPDGKFTGPLRLRQALANDTLVPLQQLLDQVGSSAAWRPAETLGLNGLARSNDAGHLLFRGGSVRLVDLAQAYSAIANLGQLTGQRVGGGPIEPYLVMRISDIQGRMLVNDSQPATQSVLSAPLAYLAHNVLSDEPARWPSQGYPNALEIGRPAGAKTGTADSGRQVWAAGYTTRHLAITWLGLAETAASAQKLDPRTAAGIWHALIQYASRDLPAAGWPVPAGVTSVEVCSPSGLLPTAACPTIVNEVFLSGNDPTGPDTLYRTFQVNRETGLLATVFTPPEQVEERTYLVLPEEAKAWGTLAGLPTPPKDYDRIQPPAALANAQIASPTQFSIVRGEVILRGTAAGDNFSYYRLQVGDGINPQSWLPLGEPSSKPVLSGLLGRWDTSRLNGLYVIRLQVVRQDNRLETALLQVTVDNTVPKVKIVYPADGVHITNSSQAITLAAEASDTVGLQRVEFILDDRPVGAISQAPFSLPWLPSRGRHNLKVVAVDLAGNSSETSISFTVD